MKTTLYPTKNDLPAGVRQAMIELLNQQLADVLDLGWQAKQAHWNVKGPQFFSLHALFDEVAGELDEFSDEIAERSVQLGGLAMGTLQAVVNSSRLPAYPLNASTGKDHLAALLSGVATLAASTRTAIDIAAEAKDADTADLFTGISRGLDKMLWKIEAHTQAGD